MKKWIYVLICILVVGIITAFVVPKQKDNPPPPNEKLEILCDDITMYLDDKPKQLKYEIINNQNLTYSKSVYTENDCVGVSNDYVFANKVGISDLTIKLTTSNSVFTKTIKVTVLETQCEIDIKVLKQNDIVDKVFVGDLYTLEVSTSKKLNYDYQVYTSTNVGDFVLLEDEDNFYRFNFKVNSTGDTKFTFEYKGVEKSLTLKTYKYISNINVKFDDEFASFVNLTLFNNDYKDIANQNNLYDCCTFEILNSLNCINDYKVEVSNEYVAKIQDNKIVAISEGECNFVVYALDGSNYSKSYKVIVAKSKAESISFNVSGLELETNEGYELEATFTPVYAFCNIEYYLNNQKLENTKIAFSEAGQYIIIAKDSISNKTVSLIISVVQPVEYIFELTFLESFMQEYNATFIDNVLTMTSQEEQSQVVFSIKIENNPYSYDCNIIYSNNNIVDSHDQILNSIIINFKAKGETYITLSLKDNSAISYVFKIVIV